MKASGPGGFCSGAGAAVYAALTASAVFAAMFAARSAVAPRVQVLRLARLPRVYNALITSEQQLLPSQADPIVAPVLRPYHVLYGWPYVAAVDPVIAVAPSYPSLSGAEEAADASTEVRKVAAVDGGDGDGGGGGDDAPRAQQPFVKNNVPADSAVPDVPPPPLPVSRVTGRKDKKKPEEYPPAPGGFAI